MIIGAQLYTLRNHCKTPEDLAETIKRVADMGYTAVQLSGVCDYDPKWMKDLLDECGIIAPLTHFNYDRIMQGTEATIEFHRVFGAPYIGIGSIPNFKKSGCDLAIYEKFIADAVPAAKKIKDAGMKLMYHNHNMEFMRLASGKLLIEDICDRIPADEMGITLDCYWVQAGGGDPVQWIEKLRGRLDCIHFKDMCWSPADLAIRMAPVGSGNMNYEAIVRASEEAGCKYAFVEQDRCYEDDDFECMKRSYDYLASLGCR